VTTADGPRAEHLDRPASVHGLQLLRREQVTPRMVRLVLGGDEVAALEPRTPDEHVKIIFPDESGELRLPTVGEKGLEWPRPFPETREYTIRRIDHAAGEVWIDFVVHEGGLASDWAQRVEPGTPVWITGPRPTYLVPAAFGHHVLLADHTALPAVARWLEELPEATTAQVAVAVPTAADEQPLAQRPGVDVTWFHEDDPAYGPGTLGDHLASLTLPEGTAVYLWAAGEAGVLKPMRTWARQHGFARGTCDIAGYWRRPRGRG
jgi:NADPH-dependent ferric siderophore reductase